MRIGVFGGEFDPPHLGHLAVVRAARDQLALDRLLVIPTGRPPHRDASPTPGEDRLRMAQLAFAGEPGVEVSRSSWTGRDRATRWTRCERWRRWASWC